MKRGDRLQEARRWVNGREFLTFTGKQFVNDGFGWWMLGTLQKERLIIKMKPGMYQRVLPGRSGDPWTGKTDISEETASETGIVVRNHPAVEDPTGEKKNTTDETGTPTGKEMMGMVEEFHTLFETIVNKIKTLQEEVVQLKEERDFFSENLKFWIQTARERR